VIALQQRTMTAAPIKLAAGWHTVTIRMASPDGRARDLAAGTIVDGHLRPFGPNDVFVRSFRPSRMVRDAIARAAAVVLDVIVVIAIGWMTLAALLDTVRGRRLGRLLWLVAICEAAWFALPWAGRSVLLSGGDDWLTYEHLARAITFGDPLLLQKGIAPGQGTPFYYQPFYPYFLALTHMLGGDAFFVAVFAQRVLLAASVSGVAAISTRLFGAPTRWVATAIGIAFLYTEIGPWTSVFLSELLFIPLFVAWIALLVTTTDGAASARLMGTALVGGLATLTRTALLLAWPPILLAWVPAVRTRRVRALTLLVVAMAVPVALMSARNSFLARGAAAPASSLGAVLYLGNEPPATLSPPPATRASLYDRFQLDSQTRLVIESALQQPRPFVDHLKNKALYTLGFFDWSGITPGYSAGLLAWPGMRRLPPTSWACVALWSAALVGLLRVLATRRSEVGALLFVPIVAAAMHFAIVVIFLPHIYGNRLILPLYPLLVPYAAAAVTPRLSVRA
jgi:hypothetical protein